MMNCSHEALLMEYGCSPRSASPVGPSSSVYRQAGLSLRHALSLCGRGLGVILRMTKLTNFMKYRAK